MGQLFTLGIALGSFAMFALFVAATIRWPLIILYGVAVFALINWEFPLTPALVNALGMSIYPEDLLITAAIVGTVLRPHHAWRILSGVRPLVLVLALVTAASLISGFAIYGSAAVTDFRAFLYPIGLTVWALNQPWTSPQWTARLTVWAKIVGIGLMLVLVFHVALYGLGAADSFVNSWLTGESRTNRPLISSQALLLACAGFLMFREAPTSRASDRYYGVVFIGGAILCQHRSVWVAVALAAAIVAVSLRGVPLARFLVAAFTVTVLALIVLLSGIAQPIVDSLVHSISSLGTLEDREASWMVLVQQTISHGPVSVIFGEPFGGGYFRLVDDREIHYGPHNWYVSIFLRLGVVGLAIFAWVLLVTLARLMRRRELAAVAVVATIAIYCWPYAISWYSCVLLGWAIVLAAQPLQPVLASHGVPTGSTVPVRRGGSR